MKERNRSTIIKTEPTGEIKAGRRVAKVTLSCGHEFNALERLHRCRPARTTICMVCESMSYHADHLGVDRNPMRTINGGQALTIAPHLHMKHFSRPDRLAIAEMAHELWNESGHSGDFLIRLSRDQPRYGGLSDEGNQLLTQFAQLEYEYIRISWSGATLPRLSVYPA